MPQRAFMATSCEVCETLRRLDHHSAGETDAPVRNLILAARLVVLCEPHASGLRDAGVDSLDGLRDLYHEQGALAHRRSLVDRRAELDRRVFPARPELRRYDSGRRSHDPE